MAESAKKRFFKINRKNRANKIKNRKMVKSNNKVIKKLSSTLK